MGKKREKKKEECKGGGAPEWMVTYSDMVTLLLTFFVMLLAMASFESPGRVDKGNNVSLTAGSICAI